MSFKDKQNISVGIIFQERDSFLLETEGGLAKLFMPPIKVDMWHRHYLDGRHSIKFVFDRPDNEEVSEQLEVFLTNVGYFLQNHNFLEDIDGVEVEYNKKIHLECEFFLENGSILFKGRVGILKRG